MYLLGGITSPAIWFVWFKVSLCSLVFLLMVCGLELLADTLGDTPGVVLGCVGEVER